MIYSSLSFIKQYTWTMKLKIWYHIPQYFNSLLLQNARLGKKMDQLDPVLIKLKTYFIFMYHIDIRGWRLFVNANIMYFILFFFDLLCVSLKAANLSIPPQGDIVPLTSLELSLISLFDIREPS